MIRQPRITARDRNQAVRGRFCAFTVVEVLAVIVIMAIVASVSIAFMSATSSKMRLHAAVQSFVADLLYAQNRAITAQKKVYVIFTPGTSGTADKYELQHPLGTVLTRADGATGTVTMGEGQTELPGAKFGFTAALTIGFDSGGQPFIRSGSTDTPITDIQRITLRNSTGSGTTTVNIQPFTGEITVQ